MGEQPQFSRIVLDAVSRFIGASNWQDRRDLFREFADTLRSPEALRLLEYNAADARHEPHIRRALSARIRLLERSREEIEKAFADQERLVGAVELFINAGSLAQRQAVAETNWETLSSVGADQVFADFLLQEWTVEEIDFIEARWDVLEEYRARGGPEALTQQRSGMAAPGIPVSERLGGETDRTGRDGTPNPIDAFLFTGRWSETQRLLEVATDDLFRPESLKEIEARAAASDDSGQRKWIESRLKLLRAAHRFGVLGAYAFAQGCGQRGIVPGELFEEFIEATRDTVRLQDLFDRHPILLKIYQKMSAERDPAEPLSLPCLPPPCLPPSVNAAFRALREVLMTEMPPARIIERLAPVPNQVDPRLYPGLCGAIHLQLAERRSTLDSSDAGLRSAMPDYDVARAIFTAERFPVDHCETALLFGQALLARGHADRAVAEFETAIEHLDVSACEDRLLMAVAPRSPESIEALRTGAELLYAEALCKMRRYKAAQERARAIEERHAAAAPDAAAKACLLQVDLAQVEEGQDPDERAQVAESACRRGLGYLNGLDTVPDTAIRLRAQLIHLLLRPAAHKWAERVAEAGELLKQAVQNVREDSVAAAELRLAEHEYITEHRREPGWEIRARGCAQEILRLAEIAHNPEVEAEGHLRMGEVAAGKGILEHYRRAAEQFAKLEQRDRQADVLRRIGDRHFDAEEWKAAAEAYNEARAVEPPLAGRAEDAFARSAKFSAFFPKAAYAAYKLGRHTEALQISEAGKARFVMAMAAGRARADDSLPSLLGGAGNGTLLVAPVVTSHGTITFVVPGSERSVSAEHVIESDLTTDRAWTELLTVWVNAYFKYSNEQDIGQWETAVGETCERLWVLLMGSVRQRIGDLGVRQGSPVLFVPPNLFAPLPFHAARDPNGAFPFTEDYPLTYAPGLSVLPRLTARRSGAHPASTLAFIDPHGDLPFSHYELRCLEQRAGGNHLQAFEGPQAKGEYFFEHASKIDYLHFACHGFHHWAKPLETGIKLADGGLGALQFLSSRVNLGQTHLVCLSACETGITTALRRVAGNTMTFGGEEYIGLPAALHAAGAEYVLSTLWPVEDYVAALLLEEFYRLHWTEGLDCFNALCEARQSLRIRTAAATISDVTRRLSEPDVSDEIAGYLADIEAFVQREYAPNDQPFAHPNCWASYVLSGWPVARQAKSS